jgi:hypothetical protein
MLLFRTLTAAGYLLLLLLLLLFLLVVAAAEAVVLPGAPLQVQRSIWWTAWPSTISCT